MDEIDEENKKVKRYTVSTIDNPYDPFDQFDQWYVFDESKGYRTCSYLARLVVFADDFGEEDKTLAIHRAVDEIVRLNTLGIYVKVYEGEFVDHSKSANLSALMD